MKEIQLMAEVKIYRSYEFIDKDPVIGRIKEMIEKERLLKKPGIVHELSGISTQTLHKWFHGETRRPQHATIMAVALSLGYRMDFKQERSINVEHERRAAKKWEERQNAKRKAEKERLIAARKAARAASTAAGAAHSRRD
jgi:transcriptional regulator with XRE-family HTH domain